MRTEQVLGFRTFFFFFFRFQIFRRVENTRLSRGCGCRQCELVFCIILVISIVVGFAKEFFQVNSDGHRYYCMLQKFVVRLCVCNNVTQVFLLYCLVRLFILSLLCIFASSCTYNRHVLYYNNIIFLSFVCFAKPNCCINILYITSLLTMLLFIILSRVVFLLCFAKHQLVIAFR